MVSTLGGGGGGGGVGGGGGGAKRIFFNELASHNLNHAAVRPCNVISKTTHFGVVPLFKTYPKTIHTYHRYPCSRPHPKRIKSFLIFKNMATLTHIYYRNPMSVSELIYKFIPF